MTTRTETEFEKKKIIVVGNGMVGYRFCKALVERDVGKQFSIRVYGEEPRPAYDRVQLTSFFTGKSAEELSLADAPWYASNDIDLQLASRVARIDRHLHRVILENGEEAEFDYVVFATGSAPFVPPIAGIEKEGVFVYRTIEDLEAIKAYAVHAKRATVIGGGLLGLEAAKAVVDLGLAVDVVEFAPRLMPRQLDDAASGLLSKKIAELGVRVLLQKQTLAIEGNGAITGLRFVDNSDIPTDMLIISAGIKPRDELARDAGLAIGQRGGILVNDTLQTSDDRIFAIGEVALHEGMIYGLVAPGYEMAEVLADHLTGGQRRFTGADMSTKLKLLGVEVASLGTADPMAAPERTVVVKDARKGIYKKITLSECGTRLEGGILVGDTADYGKLLHLFRTGEGMPTDPESLILGKGDDDGTSALPDSAQVCSCNNVSKGDICTAIRAAELTKLDEVKSCTTAGTGCGGCVPLVKDILTEELKKSGLEVKKVICEHFAMSRQELFHGIKIQQLKSYPAVLAHFGTGGGCEVCKPVVASILASLWNGLIVDQATIQDTNDRFLANIQRGGTYSVVPRVAGGEITPEKLIVLGEVARKYDLYCKITGGQRIDLLGARVEHLPDIWEELVAAGFESGHAYGKSVRTVKSCVGQTWCRYGVQDSTAFAIRIENRYRGIRSPHKLKFAVSGCVRECAEAQCKDVGLIATEKGWNLYVCGNGGAKPRHADLLISDIDEEQAITYMDRFLMYYIHTADPLQRTSVWLEKLEGGLGQLREVVINDSLGICETLEADMCRLVDTYHCEWAEVVRNPEKRALFTHYANSEAGDGTLSFVRERGQKRPADWPTSPFVSATQSVGDASWWKAGRVGTFPRDGGMAVEYGGVQLAVFHVAATGRWYVTQNMCPHKQDMVLSRGMVGEVGGVAKVACPLHKKQFSLEDGSCLSGEDLHVSTFEVRVDDGFVYVLLPPAGELASAVMPATECASANV